jgi:hypothetical protein
MDLNGAYPVFEAFQLLKKLGTQLACARNFLILGGGFTRIYEYQEGASVAGTTGTGSSRLFMKSPLLEAPERFY